VLGASAKDVIDGSTTHTPTEALWTGSLKVSDTSRPDGKTGGPEKDDWY
jgi:hypothetical protein